MKVILSRKGFDAEAGGYPSPILPDGRLVSLPIPRENAMTYGQLKLDEKRYYFDIMQELNTRIKVKKLWQELAENSNCHLDPDLNADVVKRPKDWRPLFGQVAGKQRHLLNQGVTVNDIFLFFGLFRQTEIYQDKLRFVPDAPRKHIIFGYLQVNEIIEVGPDTVLPEWMRYHPHAEPILNNKPLNTIYVARETLSWNPELPGAGTFSLRAEQVLTSEGQSVSHWDLPECFRGVPMSFHSQESWKEDYFQSAARGQEFVVEDNEDVEKWVKLLILWNIKKGR